MDSINSIQIENKIGQLLSVLDKDIENIHESVAQLNELRSLIIKRDDAALTKLLGRIQTESPKYTENDTRRQLLRKELAVALDCSIEKATLTNFESRIHGQKRAQISHRKKLLQTMISQLKREHAATKMLVSDCARINSTLLKGIFEVIQSGSVTYGPAGTTQRTGPAFMNVQY